MKKMMMIMAVMVTIATRAAAMSYTEARTDALFLTDKMAYELNLSNDQYEAVYEINLDYLMGLSYNDVLGSNWAYRNGRLFRVLDSWQYSRYMETTYFYRPVSWTNNSWHFGIYSHYTNRNHFYRPRPNAYASYHGPGNGHNPHHDNHGNVGTRPGNPGNTSNHGNVGTRPGNPGNTSNHGNVGTRPGNSGNTGNHGNVGTRPGNTGTSGRFGAHR